MKRCVLTGSGIIFSIFTFLAVCASAASISGTVSYGGSQTGSIIVAAFNYPLTCSGPYAADPNPYSLVELETIGDYTISDLPDGTYYLASVIFTDGMEGDLQATDPWAMYDGCDNITPIVLTGGVEATDKDMILVDGTVDVPNPFYSTYYIIAHSAHDPWGYWMEIFVDDSSHKATAVSVTGPGILGGTANLEYNSSEGRWDSSNTGKLAFTESPMTAPLTYFIDITDSSGTTQHEVVIQGYVEVFASNLSPDGNQVVTGNPVFSWTGVEGDYTYEIRLDSSNWHKGNLTENTIVYDGPPLIPGTNYEWHVNVFDQYNNVAYSFANFVYQATPPISLDDAINALKIVVSMPEAVPPETTLIDANSDQKIGLEEAIYALQIVAEIRPQPYGNTLGPPLIYSENRVYDPNFFGSPASYLMRTIAQSNSPNRSIYIQNNTFTVPISYSPILDRLFAPNFSYTRTFGSPYPSPGIEWEDKEYVFFVDENGNSTLDNNEDFLQCYIPPGAIRQMDIPNISVTAGGINPTISWDPVPNANNYVIYFFELTEQNQFVNLLFIVAIEEDGATYSYTYEGDLFNQHNRLAIGFVAREDYSSCVLNRSAYFTVHEQ